MRRAAIYARVSTALQSTETQIIQLRAVAERSGWLVVEEFLDQGVSGMRGRAKRPAFDRVIASRYVYCCHFLFSP